ncbi:MAG: thioredoxin family protein [Armatimonadota bacterium]
MGATSAPQEAAPPSGVHETLEDAMEAGRQTSRPVLAVFIARWCEWSAKLYNETLASPYLASLPEHFECVIVDGDARPDLVDRHKIDMYPTAIVLRPNGMELGRIEGFDTAEKWGERLRRILWPSG